MTSLLIDLYSKEQLYDELSLSIDLINIIYGYAAETTIDKIERITPYFLSNIKSGPIKVLDVLYIYDIKQKSLAIRCGNKTITGRVLTKGKNLGLLIDDIGFTIFDWNTSVSDISACVSCIQAFNRMSRESQYHTAGFLFAIYKLNCVFI